jgi:predicted nucleotidyltransferase
VRLKSVFYCLRPAAALRWLHTHPGAANPPTRLQDLLADSDTPTHVVHATDELVTLKGRTHELGTTPFPAVLRTFMLDELDATDLRGARAALALALLKGYRRCTDLCGLSELGLS